MPIHIQYHNAEREGLPFSRPFASAVNLDVRTSRATLSVGDRVFLIVGFGKPRAYFFWEAFDVSRLQVKADGHCVAKGPGWQLAPPVELNGPAFEEFKSRCANFVGLRRIDGLPYTIELERLAKRNRPMKPLKEIKAFFERLMVLSREAKSKRQGEIVNAWDPFEPQRALSIRQPHAEAIMRGIKRIEYRNGPTKVRGRILVYASLGRYTEIEEQTMMKHYGLEEVNIETLPRGVVIGSVELTECRGGEWFLANPERAKTLREPIAQPQPVWFFPFNEDTFR